MFKRNFFYVTFFIMIFIVSLCADTYTKTWPHTQRIWLAPELWANRLQDWQVNDGRLECVVSDWNRNVNVLSHRLIRSTGDFTVKVDCGLLNPGAPRKDHNWFGFRVASRGEFNDYRDDAIYGKGLDIGLTTSGTLFIGEVPVKENKNGAGVAPYLPEGVQLVVHAEPDSQFYHLKLSLTRLANGEELATIEKTDIPASTLYGSLALVSSFNKAEKNDQPSVWFDNWQISGAKIKKHTDRTYGPIMFSMYTLSRGTLKLTAQIAPIGKDDEWGVALEIKDQNGEWQTVDETSIDPVSRTATFRVSDWDVSRSHPFRIKHRYFAEGDSLATDYFYGTIQKEPWDKESIKVAAFTGNNDLGFPNKDITNHVKAHKPDLLFFSGDQIYEGVGGYGVQYAPPVNTSILDYLRKWYIFGWTYRDMTNSIPSVAIPDDHDVFHGNLWGCSGKAAGTEGTHHDRQDTGGYKQPPVFVRMVERTQTSHLPDPFDPEPVKQGIGVYYTDLNYAGVSFAIIEDRKFKSAPKPLLPEADIWNGWPQNSDFDVVHDADVPEAKLLGERQLNFLETWAADWSHKTWMKVVLSQTIFANVATLPMTAKSDKVVPKLDIVPAGTYIEGDKIVTDLDSNGWPQTGRNQALRKMRKAFAFHIAGDQHLGSSIKYGVDTWNDAGYAICVPSVSNVWPRRWYPPHEGLNPIPGQPKYTGNYLDGFGNHIRVLAVANPEKTGKKPSQLYDRATGYGIITFNRETRQITFANWSRFADPAQPDAVAYPGWPVTVDQQDNYGRAAQAWLPTINVKGMKDPVVRVIDERTNDTIYTLRIKGDSFTAKAFHHGSYKVVVGEPDTETWQEFENVKSVKKKNAKTLDVRF